MLKNFLLLIAITFSLTACSIFTSSEKSAPTSGIEAAQYNVQLGMGYLQQGDVQRAKRKLLLAMNQAPNWAPAQDAMGYFLLNTGEPGKAEAYYRKAVEIDPKAGAAQNNYGVYLCRVGRYHEADDHYILAVQDTNYVNTAEAYENAGLCAMQIPDDNKAMAYFQNAVVRDPKRATSWLEMSQITFKQNNFVLAQQYFDSYAQLTPDMNAEALWLGIRLARKLNNPTAAASYILQLQNNFPSSNEYRQFRASEPRRMPTV